MTKATSGAVDMALLDIMGERDKGYSTTIKRTAYGQWTVRITFQRKTWGSGKSYDLYDAIVAAELDRQSRIKRLLTPGETT